MKSMKKMIRGFTLIELMIVVAFLVIFAVTVDNFRQMFQ